MALQWRLMRKKTETKMVQILNAIDVRALNHELIGVAGDHKGFVVQGDDTMRGVWGDWVAFDSRDQPYVISRAVQKETYEDTGKRQCSNCEGFTMVGGECIACGYEPHMGDGI